MIIQALDHELSDAEMAELQAHLAHCAKCRTLYDDLLQIQTATTSLSRPAPETLHAHIMSCIQEDVTLNAPDNKPPIPRKKSHVKWYLTAAVFLLLISVSFFYKLHGIPGQENLLSADSKKKKTLLRKAAAKQSRKIDCNRIPRSPPLRIKKIHKPQLLKQGLLPPMRPKKSCLII